MSSPPAGRSVHPDATTPLERRVAPRPLGVLLRAVGAATTPPRLALRDGDVVVGSAPDSDLVIHDGTVSRRHCRLELRNEGVVVQDLESRNGTWFLGQRVERMVLTPGTILQVGGVTLHIDADVEDLVTEAALETESYEGLIGRSPSMRRLFAVIERLRKALVPVLIVGESGVGKELIARALHLTSRTADQPLVAVNCGAIPRELVGSELFGHKRGAFTGAHETRRGAFANADGGTLFLDEIGELPLEIQPALLRALESGEIQPVGADETQRVKVRIIAATNRDLELEVRQGRFREDLYFRLAVIPLRVPPLRERSEDIEPLAMHFAHEVGLATIEPNVMAQLQKREFAGNVRELRNAVVAYSALGSLPEPPRMQGQNLDDALEATLAGSVDVGRPYAEQKEEIGERFTRAYLKALLDRTGGNQTVAAKLAGLDRGYLGRLLAKHDLKR